jgi:hypothetical protein
VRSRQSIKGHSAFNACKQKAGINYMKTRTQNPFIALVFLALFTLNSQFSSSYAQGTAFSYSGQLSDTNGPANGTYDLTFALFATDTGGTAIAGPVTNAATEVINGQYTAVLDFGAVFDGTARWLEIGAQTNGGTGFVTLIPRQMIFAVPYAIMANSASNLLGNLPATQLTGTVPLAQLPAGLVTNGASGVTLTGAFIGDGSGLVNVNANSATTAGNFTGSLGGDVVGTQGATVVQFVGGLFSTNIASGANAANAANSLNVSNTIVKRSATGAFSAGAITATSINGSGAGLTTLNASSLSSGTVSFARLPSTVLTNFAQAVNLTGTFNGNGAGLTNLNVTGAHRGYQWYQWVRWD